MNRRNYVLGIGGVLFALIGGIAWWLGSKPSGWCCKSHQLPNVHLIERVLRTKAVVFGNEKVVKVSFPRQDLQVAVDGWRLQPFMGLTSWVAFQPGSKRGVEVMAMGDLVLLEHEVPAAMRVALEHHIAITALHNHFFADVPKIYFMHINAEGACKSLAEGLRAVFDAISQVEPADTNVRRDAPDNTINGMVIEKIMGVPGQAQDGMFKVVIGRQTKAGCGCIVGKNMGINTWAAFSGSNEHAVVAGDVVVLEDELQDVLGVLLAHHINVVAIHNHMLHENPRLIFLHFWGEGAVADLALGLQAALATTGTLSSGVTTQPTECIAEISAEELKAILHNDATALLVNTLSPDVHEDCHIKARESINFPFYLEGAALQTWERELLKKHSHAKDEPIYVYCTSRACAAGQMACKVLLERGFKKIFEYKGGTREWLEKYGKDACIGPCKARYLYN